MFNPRQKKPVEYPSSDGKPVAENDINREDLLDAVKALDHWFRDRDDVYVSGNMLVFDTEGNNRRHLAPDVFVAMGAERRMRENYCLWLEKPITVIIEILSRTTFREDIGPKKERYAKWGVKELYFFDPKHVYITPPLQGYRLDRGLWVPLEGAESIYCASLDLDVFYDDDRLRFRDPATGFVLPTYRELALHTESLALQVSGLEQQAGAARQQAAAARKRAAAERARRIALEDEIKKLRGT